MPTVTPADWERRYQESDTPWDSGLPSRELARVLDETDIPRGRAIELGCGTGINAVFLAQAGFEVTAVDFAEGALDEARRRALSAGVEVTFICADVCRFEHEIEPFDIVFDRGCYHCVRRVDLPGFLSTLKRLTRPGSIWLSLAGNANEQAETEGPPRVTEEELRSELESLFAINQLREFRFEDAGGVEGPLGWSVLMTRRGS